MLLFCAITNMNLYNVLNVKVTSYPKNDADLVIFMSNRISFPLLTIISDMHIFKNIILIPSLDSRDTTFTGRFKKIKFIESYGIATQELNNQLQDKIPCNLNNYSTIFVDALNLSVLVLLNILSKTSSFNISIIEEGAGVAYSSKNQLYCNNPVENILYYITCAITRQLPHKKRFIKKINELYLYNTEAQCTKSEFGLDIIQIPLINNSDNITYKVLKKLAESIDVSEYSTRKAYYFTSVTSIVENSYDALFQDVDSIVSTIPMKEVIIKDHPRAKLSDDDVYSQYKPDIYIDSRNYLLESIFVTSNLDDKILISESSSLLLQPKYMFGKEPYIIFTAKLHNRLTPVIEKMITDLRLRYQDPTKIYLPDTYNQLQMIISDIYSKT